jgi:hypothetical protein
VAEQRQPPGVRREVLQGPGHQHGGGGEGVLQGHRQEPEAADAGPLGDGRAPEDVRGRQGGGGSAQAVDRRLRPGDGGLPPARLRHLRVRGPARNRVLPGRHRPQPPGGGRLQDDAAQGAVGAPAAQPPREAAEGVPALGVRGGEGVLPPRRGEPQLDHHRHEPGLPREEPAGAPAAALQLRHQAAGGVGRLATPLHRHESGQVRRSHLPQGGPPPPPPAGGGRAGDRAPGDDRRHPDAPGEPGERHRGGVEFLVAPPSSWARWSRTS